MACREPGVVIRHKARKDWRALLKQMWGWGIRLARPYSKTGYRGLYLYWVSHRTHTIDYDIEIDGGPTLVWAFLADFHLAHLLFGLAAIFWLLAAPLWAGGTALLGAGLFWRYLSDVRLAKLSRWRTFKMALIHYAANVTFITASFVGGLRCRMILIPASILPPRGAGEL